MNVYKIIIKINGIKVLGGSMLGDKLEIKESSTNKNIKYIDIHINNIQVRSNAIFGNIEVEKEKEDISKVIINY